MKILMTGATGFLGQALGIELVRRGHELRALTRDKNTAWKRLPFPCEVFSWNPSVDVPPVDALEGVDAVVHLAGEPVAAKRWTAEQKKKIFDSRVLSTRNLVSGLRAIQGKRPSVFVTASAIGIYGDRGSEELDENSPIGNDFLADVCKQWEHEAFILAPEVRVAAIRIGIVLGKSGGAMEKILPPFKAGVGGPLGSGKQWMSWVHLDDLVSLFVTALENSAYQGPINGVAPEAVTNEVFSRQLAAVLGKPNLFRAPKIALQIALGEMAKVVLASQRVVPLKAQKLGFQYKFTKLDAALADLFKTPDDEFLAAQYIDKPIGEIFPFFSDAKNLETLTPPWLGFNVLKMSTDEIQDGTLIDYKLKLHGIPVHWQSRIEEWLPGKKFVDTQMKGPYSKWHHTHEFERLGRGTLMHDRVIYRVPGSIFGKAAMGSKIKGQIEEIFTYRREKIREIFG